MSDQGRLDFDAVDPLEHRDAQARAAAVDPLRNVALEASAGTGKTRVLVDRYVGLLLAGVEPRNILAITFTRKAAAEMRQRILDTLSGKRREGSLAAEQWNAIRDQVGEIAISTIDAFCLALLREFPLEADVEPGFELADETETPRLVNDALDRTLRVGRGLAAADEDVSLVFAELGEFRLREGLARLLDRRLVAIDALNRFLRGPDVSVDDSVSRLAGTLRDAFASQPGGLEALILSGPAHPGFDRFVRDARAMVAGTPRPEVAQALLEGISAHLLTRDGAPRKRLEYKIADFRSRADYDRHLAAVTALGPYVVAAVDAYRRDLNRVLARGVRRLFFIALAQYRRTLDKHGVLDFSDVLEKTLVLLRQRDEFSRSRYKLEARFQHVLVDEFQDTSRAQWELVQQLIASWAEGAGMIDTGLPPSIFIVGDRKQSIYGFRDAEVAVLESASRFIQALRPSGHSRYAITRSFRSVRELLGFTNDLFAAVDKQPARSDAFRYGEDDAFPLGSVPASGGERVLGIAAGESDEWQAAAMADEIARLLITGAVVRDRTTGVRRAVAPGDIAVLFRTREGHRLYEEALEARRVPYYVYKGLGFFDADEIKDVLALLAFLADPHSELRVAAFLRSRFVRLSDAALRHLAPKLSDAVMLPAPPAAIERLDEDDSARLLALRASLPGWVGAVDRLPPAELLDTILAESAYAAEIAGPSLRQARENLKKVRGLVRRVQNRGYATLGRIVEHFAQMVAGGDESNAMVDAVDAVNLMTVHAAKGLEFPVVFVANLAKGSGGSPDPIRVSPPPFDAGDEVEAAVAIGQHESDADRDADARETEEGKRLLYVALTRARDRLYLGTTLDRQGRFAAARGSLGRVVPPDFAQVVSLAGSTREDGVVTWEGPSAVHHLTVLTPADVPLAFQPEADDRCGEDDFAPLAAAGGVSRTSATAHAHVAASDGAPLAARSPASLETSPLIGALVHRALAAGLAPDAPGLPSAVAALVRPDDRPDGEPIDEVVSHAVRAYVALRTRPDVEAVLAAGAASHEVPFALKLDAATVVRGVMDCVVQAPSGAVVVLEFKTGARMPAHDVQLSLYVRAAAGLYGATDVRGELIYVD